MQVKGKGTAALPLHVATHLAPLHMCLAGPTTPLLLPPLKYSRRPRVLSPSPASHPIPTKPTNSNSKFQLGSKGRGQSQKPPNLGRFRRSAPRLRPPCSLRRLAAYIRRRAALTGGARSNGGQLLEDSGGDGVAGRVREAGDQDEHPARGDRQWRVPHRDAGPGGQRQEERRAAGGGAGARRPRPPHQEGLHLLRRPLVHGRLPRHRPPRPQAHRRQRHLLHPAVAGDVERAGAAGGAGGAHGAGAHRRRPHGPPLRGVRRARRHGLQRGGGARVDPPRPPRLRRLPPRRRRPRRPHPAPPPPPATRRRERRARRRRRARRPPPAPAHGRGAGPGPRRGGGVPDAGGLRRELGGARVLGGHRAVPGPAQVAVRRRLHAPRHGLRRLPRHRRHLRRPGAPGVLHPARGWEPYPDRGREPESEPVHPSGHRTEITRGCETGTVHAGQARAAVRCHANVQGERTACSSGRGVDQGRRGVQRVLRDRRCRQCGRPECH